ncbi:MAG: hypothetical protein ABH810_03945 [bacterium]
MQKSIRREKLTEYIKHSVDIYLSQNIEKLGLVHIIDVNLSEDSKTAFVYISCPIHQNEKKLENSIINDRRDISEIFKKMFSSKYIPKVKIVCVKETDVKL